MWRSFVFFISSSGGDEFGDAADGFGDDDDDGEGGAWDVDDELELPPDLVSMSTWRRMDDWLSDR